MYRRQERPPRPKQGGRENTDADDADGSEGPVDSGGEGPAHGGPRGVTWSLVQAEDWSGGALTPRPKLPPSSRPGQAQP